jgi:5-methyltetrahydrofolate--homocysteine methyltransferase
MMENDFIADFVTLDREKIFGNAEQLIRQGEEPADILAACRSSIENILKQYEKREIYSDSVIKATDIAREVRDYIECLIPTKERAFTGQIVSCTVFNDIHQNGRLMGVSLLRAVGFEVFDIGSDIPAETVVLELRRSKAPILVLSGLVSSCIEPMKITIDKVRSEGLEPKILIASGIASDALCEYTGADAYADDFILATRICQGWAED